MKSTKKRITSTRNTQVSLQVDEIIKKISFSWNKAREYIIDVAVLLNQYQSDKNNQQLWYQIRQELIQRGIIGKTVISNLCSIGRNEVLLKNIHLLPNAYTTMAALASIPEKELNKMFKSGQITPDLKLEQIRQWKTLSDIDGVEVLEVVQNKNEKLKAVTIYISESDIVRKYELIDQLLLDLKSKMRYATIERNGLLKKKITGD
jgi:hypothetical protein